MIDKEDNFNEFLKQKVEESRFEYNEAYWLKAEKLIANSQPKRKPFWFGFGWGMLSLAFIGGISIFILNDKLDNSKVEQTPNIANASLLSESMNTQKEVTNQPEKTFENDSKPSLQSGQEQKSALNQNLVVKSSATSFYAKSSKQTKGSTAVLHALNNRNDKKEAALLASVNGGAEGNFSQVRNLTIPKLPESLATETEEVVGADNPVVITIAEPIVLKRKTPSVKDIDVNIVAACENKNTNEWMFNVLAGVSDSRGFEGNTVTSSRIGFGYFGGLRLGYKLDKNWFVGVQPLVYSRGAINTSIQTEKTAYDFGANADEFIVKNKALLFAEIPVTIGYRIQRHQISVGAGFEYLVNVKSDVKDFGTNEYKPNQWGYTNGFNRFGTIALFNYAFNVYNEFWLTMMVQKGFTDLTKTDYFTTNSKDKNFNLRIGVQYQFNNQKKKGK